MSETSNLPTAASGFLAKQRQNWNAFYFRPGSPVALGALRIIFFACVIGLFVIFDPLNRWNASTVQPQTYRPIGLLDWTNAPLMSQSRVDVLFGVFVVGNVLAMVGLLTRTSAMLAGLTGLYLYAMPSSFGKVGHGNMLLLFTTFTFALSRAGDALSFDAIISRLRGKTPPGWAKEYRSGEYTWPIRTVWLFMTLIFFATGIAKLRWGGYDWLFTPHLASTIRQHYLLPGGAAPSSQIGLWIAQFEWLCIATAWLTVFVELFFPLALLNKWGRLFFPTAMFCLQFGIGWSMGIFFWTFFIGYVFWLPWELVGRRRQLTATI